MVTLQAGQVLGKAKNRENWLKRHNKYLKEALQYTEAHAQLIRKLASIRTPNPKLAVSAPNFAATVTSHKLAFITHHRLWQFIHMAFG